MRRYLAIGFGLLMVSALVAWITGWVFGAVIPLFGGVKAEKVGQFCLFLAGAGEVGVYLFGWLFKKLDPDKGDEFTEFKGGKRYGNKPPAMPSARKPNH